jgi:hypothetical protein
MVDLLLMIIQDATQQAEPKIEQTTVVWILIAATLLVLCLLILLGIFAWKKTERSQEFGGNFFVVIFGIPAALIGFLVAFPLILSGVSGFFPKQWIAISGPIATIMVLLANYPFKVRSDESRGEELKWSMGFFLEHFAVLLSLLYGWFTVIGIFYSYILYRQFRINIFDYAEIGDFLLAPFRNRVTLLVLGSLLVFIVIEAVFLYALDRYRNRRWLSTIIIIVPALTFGVFMGFAVSVPNSVVETAHSIKQGKQPRVDVRFSSSSGSADQTTEPRLVFIGATQRAAFFYDVNDIDNEKDNNTLVIPQSQIVSIEVPE